MPRFAQYEFSLLPCHDDAREVGGRERGERGERESERGAGESERGGPRRTKEVCCPWCEREVRGKGDGHLSDPRDDDEGRGEAILEEQARRLLPLLALVRPRVAQHQRDRPEVLQKLHREGRAGLETRYMRSGERDAVPLCTHVAVPCVPYMTILMLPVPMVVRAPMYAKRSAAWALVGDDR